MLSGAGSNGYHECRGIPTEIHPCLAAGAAVRRALTRNTAAVVASAPGFPHGVVDHVADIAKVCVGGLALTLCLSWSLLFAPMRRASIPQLPWPLPASAGPICCCRASLPYMTCCMLQVCAPRGVWVHVDACLGGFVLPFARKLGYDIPPFDFAVKVGERSGMLRGRSRHACGRPAQGSCVPKLHGKSTPRKQDDIAILSLRRACAPSAWTPTSLPWPTRAAAWCCTRTPTCASTR